MDKPDPTGQTASGQDTPTDQQDAVKAQPDKSVAQLQAELEKAGEQIRASEERFLRAAAELENFRKRAARDLEHARKYGLETFAGELLQVRDSLELGMAAANSEEATLESLREGTEMTLRLLSQVMEKFGVVKIDSEGAEFDPSLHEAMVMLESDARPNTIVEVVQNGYQINGRLLRPARVVVAKAAEGKSRDTA